MKPPPFAYVAPATEDAVLEALARHGAEARVLAGGQSLVAMLNMRLVRPALVVDIMRIPSLTRAELSRGRLVIGAGVRQEALQTRTDLLGEMPLLAKALPWVGHWQTRSRGTVCGSIAHADPSAELPLCLAALGGSVHLRSRRARRDVAAADFFLGTMQTARADDEMITAVSLPLPRPGERHGFAEFGRRHGDFAIVACAAVVGPSTIRLAVGGVEDQPALRDLPLLAGAALDDALGDLAHGLEARGDQHATARYRRDLVRHLARQAIEEARA